MLRKITSCIFIFSLFLSCSFIPVAANSEVEGIDPTNMTYAQVLKKLEPEFYSQLSDDLLEYYEHASFDEVTAEKPTTRLVSLIETYCSLTKSGDYMKAYGDSSAQYPGTSRKPISNTLVVFMMKDGVIVDSNSKVKTSDTFISVNLSTKITGKGGYRAKSVATVTYKSVVDGHPFSNSATYWSTLISV